jgi:hypothetical protein
MTIVSAQGHGGAMVAFVTEIHNTVTISDSFTNLSSFSLPAFSRSEKHTVLPSDLLLEL